jgi:hypothetical protein
MNNIIQSQMSEQEYQFCKEQLTTTVKSYLELDDQIKALNKALVDRRKQKTKMTSEILEMMKKFEIDNMNTKNGRLIYSVNKTFKPLNKTNLLSGLNMYFKNDDQAKTVTQVVLDNREKVEKVNLRRTINKKPANLI